MEYRPSYELERELFDKVGLKLGYPALPPEKAQAYQSFGFEIIDMPYSPHVFYTPALSLETWQKQRRETISTLATLENVMVIIGHGQAFRQNGEEVWRFLGTQKSIEETVRKYQEFAKEHALPPIDVVLACRGEERNPPLTPPPSTIEVRKAPAPIRVSKGHTYPYIFPNDFVGASGVVVNGLVTSVRGITEGWQGLKEWQSYWERNQSRSPESIPQWAKEPNKS